MRGKDGEIAAGRQAETPPEESAIRLKAVMETATDGIVAIDEGGIIDSFNPAAERIFGYAAAEVIGRNVSMLMPEPYRSSHDGYIRRHLTIGEKRIIGTIREVAGQRRDGTTFPLELGVGEGNVDGRHIFTGILRDISERKHAEQERERLISDLEEKNAELERFTYTVSHDLKSPLVTIRGFLGLLEKDIDEGNADRIKGDIQRINTAAGHMHHLLAGLLELSRIGRLVHPPQEIPLGELAGEAKTLLAGALADRGVRVETAPDLPTIFGDRPRLLEVLQNLIENAVKFMGDQPEPCIEIGARQENGDTICYVRDNGIGIDPTYHEKIFGLFDRLDQTGEGAGVGLAIVRRIVEVHGGRIWVESEGKGSGSTFCFVLPPKGQQTDERSE